MDVKVSGITARVEVEQQFLNSGNDWVDALYVFPLPDESSVDQLQMKIGERVITGHIKEKSIAKKIHEKASREGRKSTLLEQNRPNIFTTNVANIGPGETVVVVIEYQQTIRFTDSVFSIRFPMVVAPRYIPGKTLSEEGGDPVSFSESGWGQDTDEVPDGSKISPAVDLGATSTIPVQLTVDLAAGFPVGKIDSLYHGIKATQMSASHYAITLTGEIKADRDFVLEWRGNGTATATTAALFAETKGDDQYMLLMIMPPHVKMNNPVPREMVFILDVSGSMAGNSIVQAKAAISLALESLRPIDRFNVIFFNNRANALYPVSKPADASHIKKALERIKNVEADGGTEMKSALLIGLDGKKQYERMRQVVFLTDGAVGNEQMLLELINKRLGDSRLFTVGIGSAPNSYFMTRAANIGRGTFTYIGTSAEVSEKMGHLFEKLENPVLSDLQLNLGGNETDVEYYPYPLPDLYHGEPLYLSVRTGWENESLHLTGNQLGKLWATKIDTTTYGKREGIGALWARKKIRSQMESLALGADKNRVREVVLKTALTHHLVSKYTSLVATDSKVSRPPGKESKKTVNSTHLPSGWKNPSLFGGNPQTATPAAMFLLVGLLVALLSIILYLYQGRSCQNRN